MFDFTNRIFGKRSAFNKKEKVSDYEHREQLTTMLKVIYLCEMPEHIKAVMRTRIWGLDPKIFAPATAYQIAYLNKGGRLYSNGAFPPESVIKFLRNNIPTRTEVLQIEEYEKQGKFYCEQFLLSFKAQEIVDKFNRDFTKNKGQMFAKTEFEKRRFSV